VPGSVSQSRRAAFQALVRVETNDAFAADVIHTDELFATMAERDRSLAQEIILGCLRWQGTIDAMLAQVARNPIEQLDQEVRIALRMACYQMRFLDRIPDRAAVSESVELVKTSRRRSAAGFVNAVLRRLPERTRDEAELERAHPRWLVDRWRDAYDPQTVRELLEANQKQPPTYLRLNTQYPIDETLDQLRIQGVETEATELPYARLLVRGRLASTRSWRHGRVRIQNIGSQMVVPMLEPAAGHRFLDVCAAPGGKTSQALELVGPELKAVAADRHRHRLHILKRLVTTRVDRVVLDAAASLPFREKFDRVLVDAPCSGTGTLAGNPEIKWRLRPEDLDDLAAKQRTILENALDALAPGGVLVYSTCSLEQEENRGVVDAVLNERTEFRSDAYLDRVPGRDAGDGFFACRIIHRDG